MNTSSNIHLSFFRSLKGKLVLIFLAISLMPLIMVGTLSYIQTQSALQAEVINKLIAVRDIKSKQITNYFTERLADIKILSNNPTVISAMQDFETIFNDNESNIATYRSLYLNQPDLVNADDGSDYSKIHAKYHKMFKEYQSAYHYHDIFLVEPHSGNIVYSVDKENDFITDLLDGPYSNSNISNVFKQMLQANNHDATLLEDFAYYEPSKKAAAFLASPIFDENKLIGVLIFQLSTDSIDAIMQEHAGLGDTGETLLVSLDDFLLRSNSRLIKENTLFKHKIDNAATRAAYVGQTGVKTVNYLDNLSIIAYTPLTISGINWSLITKIDEAEAFAILQQLLIWMLSIIGIGIILVVFIAFFFSNSLVKPIQTMTNIAQQLANGNLNVDFATKNSKDEIGLMGNSFQQMVINLRAIIDDVTSVSQGLMVGNLNITPKAKYQGDFSQIKIALQTTISNLRSVIKDIIEISQKLVEGKQQVIAKAEYNGDFLPIKNSLETASIKLAESTEQNNIQNWFKTGQTQLNNEMSGEQEMAELAKNIISFISTYLKIPVGIFYLFEEAKEDTKTASLKLLASYAYTHRKGIKSEFLIGEGLVGQAALEQKELLINKVPEDYYIRISSGLGQALPKSVIVQPFLYETELKGVIELASFKPITVIQREFLTQIMPNIGIAINTANSRSQMQKLLQQSQTQSEELQAQQEELQSQQEELRQTNETLEARTQDLEQQKVDVQTKNHTLEVNRVEMEKVQIEMEKAQAAITIKAEELELASKYKSEFLANMSHELRTPLNSLLILSKLLADNNSGNLDNKQIEYAQTINSAGNDLLTLINDILDLSKVEAGKVEVQWEDVSLQQLLTLISQKFAPIAHDKGVQFNLNIADGIPAHLLTDGQRIKQIINNLLSNAFKFTSEGEVKLTVQHPTEIPINLDKLELDKTIAISVTDSGIGIPKDKQHSIFEAFQQADGSTSRKYGGTGLGLSISRQLARLLEGELTLTSENGEGSTFTLYLPEKYVKSAPKETIQKIELTESIEEPPLLTEEYKSPDNMLVADDRESLLSEDKTILVIEDDRKFSNILRDLAYDKGFKCLLAEDGITGLQLAIEYSPSAIILDVGLPKLDGMTVMEKLKDNSDTRHIPVHFMSATEQSINAKKMGAIGYLVKPISMEKLKEAFKKIEAFLAKTVKTLLIVADSEPNQQRIMELTADENLQVEVAMTGETACQKLLGTTYDCVILDMDLEQGNGSKLLEKMQQEKGHPCKIPIIVYADRDLTTEEEALLLRCSEEIPIKPVSSPEFLVNEATLFLHQIESGLSVNKRNMLHMVHDKKAILKGKKVLVVDDDERNIFALATILENHDAEVACAVNGKESLEILECNSDIAIVLMDIMMPEMDGYEAIQAIRKQKKYDKLPIIALTAKAMKDDKAKCIEAGANDYLTKPVDTDKLLSLMRVWLYR